jgi:predicted nucleic acid-binding protein
MLKSSRLYSARTSPASTLRGVRPENPSIVQFAAPIAVLDTNVVFDCLLFRDPDCSLLQQWLDDGRLRWLGSEAMRAEFAHVLGRGGLAASQPDTRGLLAAWDRLCLPGPPGAPSNLHCTDPDDQKFIDFALTYGARWLISRDRAVLKLARRASPLGLAILTPRAWAATHTAIAG